MSSPPPIQRKIFIAGNWKSNGDRAFVNKHCMFLSEVKTDKNKTELCIAPPNIHLSTCQKFLAHLFHIASQNISEFDNGSYTGEISAKQIKDELVKKGYKIDKKQVELKENLTTLGYHYVDINLYKDIYAKVKVSIVK